jgi:competence protein ComEA
VIAGLLLMALLAGAPKASEGPPVDLNRATVEELCTLPGIGKKKAEAIVALRERKPFTRVTQLLQIKGIGPRTLQRMRPRLVVGSRVDPAAVPAPELQPLVLPAG